MLSLVHKQAATLTRADAEGMKESVFENKFGVVGESLGQNPDYTMEKTL